MHLLFNLTVDFERKPSDRYTTLNTFWRGGRRSGRYAALEAAWCVFYPIGDDYFGGNCPGPVTTLHRFHTYP